MDEASKTKKYFGELEKEIFKGSGIDIGCGKDPIFDNVKRFDMEDGDANKITKYVHEKFDFVFSAHCLEHMFKPQKQLVKVGGYLYIIVPDEDLYEQGNWPSLFNFDHKNTFTICKEKSWSPVSNNVSDLIKTLPNAKIIKIQLQDFKYDYSIVGQNVDQTLGEATAQICVIVQKIEKQNMKSMFYHPKFQYFMYKILSKITSGKRQKNMKN